METMPSKDSSVATHEMSSSMLMEDITTREQSTRNVSAKHALALMESIAAVGLIQPIVVDAQGALLAGGHRLRAIQLLKETRPDTFSRLFPDAAVPVRMMALEGSEDAEKKAFEIELSENEKRRDYTGKERSALVARLRRAGYKSSGPGARKKGETQKHVTEALALILGKSRRQIQRMLSSPTLAAKPTGQEAAMATCLKSVKRALESSVATDSLEDSAIILIEAIEREVQRLSETSAKEVRSKRAGKAA